MTNGTPNCFGVPFLFALLQDDFTIFGIHRQAAARFQGAVDDALGGGVLHSLADDAAQVLAKI